MEENSVLQRLGMFEKLGNSFKTTNCIENVNKSLRALHGSSESLAEQRSTAAMGGNGPLGD